MFSLLHSSRCTGDAFRTLPNIYNKVFCQNSKQLFLFFYLALLSPTFTNYRTAGEGGGHFFNSSLSLPPASQTLRH